MILVADSNLFWKKQVWATNIQGQVKWFNNGIKFLVEYDNDLAIRGHIEKILRSWEPVNDMRSAFENFQIEIDRIDKRLKALFIDEKRTHIDKWWLAGILKNGSGDYANDIKSDCGIVLSA